jgi:SPX domain protein involved in polyphosphate accumulation
MKFGVTIKDALHEEWSKYYVDYAGLKKFIKSRQAKKQWDENDEQVFVRELDQELQKVANFQERKVIIVSLSRILSFCIPSKSS